MMLSKRPAANVMKAVILGVLEKLLPVKMEHVLMDMIRTQAPPVFLIPTALRITALIVTLLQMVIVQNVLMDT